MSYLEELSQMDLVSCRDRFFELCDSPAQAQECVLLDMVSRNADTEFGRLHGFADIHSVEEYRNRLPVSDWNSFEPYSNQMQEGAQDVLFSGAPNMFLLSSGTTGKTKYIPESAEGARAKEVTSKLRRLLMIPHLFAIPNFCFLPFSNRAVLNRTPAGIPACTASGVTLMSTPPDIRERIAFPLDVLRCDDPGALDYLAMRFALEKDVNMIVGNNPVRMAQFFAMADARKEELLEDIARGVVGGQIAIEESLRAQLETRCGAPNPERARELAALAERRGCLAPRDYWPGLRVASCWLSGSVGGHVTSLHPWVGDAIQFLDCGYGASEGKFNVPLENGKSAGALSLFGYFFEFIPAEGGEAFLAHELEDGARYQMIITSYSGLYRYDIHDIVRVEGFTGKTPNIYFETKTSDFANVNGEKVSGTLLVALLRELTAAAGIHLVHAAVIADESHCRYDFAMECVPDAGLDTAFTEAVDTVLCTRELAYGMWRSQHIIAPPRILVMRSGWQRAVTERHSRPGLPANQVKLPTVYATPPCPEMIERIVTFA